MKLVKQQVTLPIKNFDCGIEVGRLKNGPLLPNSIRALICGPSGAGKTNLMFCLLTDRNGLKFENVYVYSKSLYQPKYIQLAEIMKDIKEVSYETFSNTCEVLPPDKAKTNSVFIFDDVICDKQENMKLYFSMGRHRLVDSFYLCQTYTKVPKHLIRDNANIIILFKQDELNLKHVYQDHVSPDITFEEFKKICKVCWDGKHSFLTIDKESDVTKGKFRKNLDEFVTI
jgi:hypothetical protein